MGWVFYLVMRLDFLSLRKKVLIFSRMFGFLESLLEDGCKLDLENSFEAWFH